MSKNVILFGGTFDPIHNGHLTIASHALNELKQDEVWFLIAKKPRWKRGVTPTSKRLKMLELGICDEPLFKICRYEIDQPSAKVNYTIDTVKALKKLYPDFNFTYLIGADQLDKLHLWKEIVELSNLISFACIKRPNYKLNMRNAINYNVVILNYEGPNISSSDIRQQYDKDKVPLLVHQYIINHYLFIEARIKNYMSMDRVLHTMSVAKLAKRIAKANNYDPNKAYLAAMLHDIAKEINEDVLTKIMEESYPDYVNEPVATYHQYVGEYLAINEFMIKDEEILSSIRKHCTASKDMSTLDKIIYCADKIEPTRGYDSSDLINECLNDIDLGYEIVFKENLEYLSNINRNY
ncbi:TPA: nicotinate (nicotinamide) nucleotide adenylyltransferase [bacterium]|nr:nicotinate (nicotinamide) nucleotide adenylyltransferase [bacterium]